MMTVANMSAPMLYRALLKYGKALNYTNKDFYLHRIREEFHRNKHLTNKAEIKRCIQVSTCSFYLIFLSRKICIAIMENMHSSLDISIHAIFFLKKEGRKCFI